MDRDVLFVIAAPFEDAAYPGETWFCRDCATMEGALIANPHWAHQIEVKRLPYPRPRADVIALIGEANQSMPALVIADSSKAPEDAKMHEGRAFLTDTKAMTRYLARWYGGAGPHP